MPARKTPFLDQRVREKIRASMLIRALTDCVEGRNKMTSVQVSSGSTFEEGRAGPGRCRIQR